MSHRIPIAAPVAVRPWFGLAVGVAWIVGLTGLKLLFSEAIGTRTPFLLYFSGVLLAGWFGGLNAGLADARIRARITELGGTPLGGTPQEFATIIAEATDKWAKVIKFANIKVE